MVGRSPVGSARSRHGTWPICAFLRLRARFERSSSYVERRSRLGRGSALDGAGKRAAFALYYAPLHLLTVQRIVQALHPLPVGTILDLGCGTGAAGCAWALAQAASGEPPPRLHGIDRHPWAVAETRWTYSARSSRARGQRELDRASFLERGRASSPPTR